MKIVSTWRCLCGTHVKVVGDSDQSNSTSTSIAACPKCGAEQTVYVEKIISVSDDTENAIQGQD
jgi:hypothetical protein